MVTEDWFNRAKKNQKKKKEKLGRRTLTTQPITEIYNTLVTKDIGPLLF